MVSRSDLFYQIAGGFVVKVGNRLPGDSLLFILFLLRFESEFNENLLETETKDKQWKNLSIPEEEEKEEEEKEKASRTAH